MDTPHTTHPTPCEAVFGRERLNDDCAVVGRVMMLLDSTDNDSDRSNDSAAILPKVGPPAHA